MTIADSINVFLQNSRQEVERINADCEERLEGCNARLQELDRQVREVKAVIEKVYADKDAQVDRVETMNAGALAYHNFLRDAGLLDAEKLASMSPISAPTPNESVEAEPRKIKLAAKATVEEEPELPEIKRPDFDLDEYDESFDVSGEDDDYEDADDVSDYVPASDVLEDADDEDEFECDEESEEDSDADDEDEFDDEEDSESKEVPSSPKLWPLLKNTVFTLDFETGGYKPVAIGTEEYADSGRCYVYGYGDYEQNGVETGEQYPWDIKEATDVDQVSDALKRRREFTFWLHGEAQKIEELSVAGNCRLGKPKWNATIDSDGLAFAAKNRPDMFDARTDWDKYEGMEKNKTKVFGVRRWYPGEDADFELIKTMFERKTFRLNVAEYMEESGQTLESFKLLWNKLSRMSAVPYCRFRLTRDPRPNEDPYRVESSYGKCRFDEIFIEMVATCDPEDDDTLKMNYELALQPR